MEEKSESPTGLSGRLEIQPPAPRTDDVGLLAARLCADPPDFTAGVPLVEAVRESHGDAAAESLATRLIEVVSMAFDEHGPVRYAQRHLVINRARLKLRKACQLYLYDFTSVFTQMARLVAVALEPVAPPPVVREEVDVVRVDLPDGFSVGDRVQMSDDLDGVIVTGRGTDGRYGVVVAGNSGPRAYTSDSLESDAG